MPKNKTASKTGTAKSPRGTLRSDAKTNEIQPTGVTKEQASANAAAVSKADKLATDNSAFRKTDPETGRPLLDVKLEEPVNTAPTEKAPTEDASTKERETEEPAPVRSVAQLRDRGIEAGVMPTSAQVEEMREIETKGLEELSKEVRLPASATENK